LAVSIIRNIIALALAPRSYWQKENSCGQLTNALWLYNPSIAAQLQTTDRNSACFEWCRNLLGLFPELLSAPHQILPGMSPTAYGDFLRQIVVGIAIRMRETTKSF
jgi:hypothetical protein